MPEKNTSALFIPEYMRSLFKYSNGYSGIDGIVMGYLVKQLNITPIFDQLHEEDFGSWNSAKSSFTGVLGDVIYNVSDVAVNARFMKNYGEDTHDVAEFLSPIFFDKMCIVTPKAQEVPKWKAPLLIFHWPLWVIILSLQIFTTIIWNLLRKWYLM